MKKLSKEKRDRLILLVIGAGGAIIGLYYGVVSAQQKTLEDLARGRADWEIKLNGATRLTTTAPQIHQALETTFAKLKAIESSMASGDKYSWIIQTVNTFKESYHVDIPQFSRELPSDVGMYAKSKFPYSAAIFHLRGTAHFHDFGKFVADFENTFPYMRIQNIELEPAAVSNASAQYDEEKLAFKLEIVALVNPNNR